MAVTPEQRLNVDIFSLKMIIIGSFAGAVGLVVMFFWLKTWWYLAISVVLFFSGIMQITQYIEKCQMLQTFKEVERLDRINNETEGDYIG